MKHQLNANSISTTHYATVSQSDLETITAFSNTNEKSGFLHQYSLQNLEDVLTKLSMPAGKESFLVFKNNKYISIRTENIAYFYVKYDSTIIVTYSNQEFFVNHSLEQIQQLLPGKQFFRLNRQHLISFNAIKEVEHYFARKLLVNAVVSTKEKLIVPKEKVTGFLHWLDNR